MRFLKNTSKIILLLVALLLVLLPYASKYAAILYLETEKNIETNIDDISINLFTGKVSLEGLHLYGEELGELHLGQFLVNLSISELFKKNILIESIVVKDFTTNITELDNAWNVGGIYIPITKNEVADEAYQPEIKTDESKSSGWGWGYGIESVFFSSIKANISSQYTDSYFALNKLKVINAMSWHPANISKIELDLSINGNTFNAYGDVTPFMEEPFIKTKIRINDIQLKPFLKSVKDLPFNETRAALFSDSELEIFLKDNQVELAINGNYGLKNIYLKDETREISLEKLTWNGQQKIVLPEQNPKNINIDGLFSIENIDITDIQNNARILQEKIALTGKYHIKLDDKVELPDIVASATLALGKLNVHTLDEKIKLASFDDWEIGEIKVNSIEDVVIQHSELNNMVLLKDVANKKLPAVAEFEKFIIKDIQYQPDLIKVDKIELRHLNADVRLDKHGEILALTSVLPKSENSKNDTDTTQDEKAESQPSPTPESITKTKGDKTPIAIIVNTISLNSNSNIRFIDHSVTPIFDTKLHNLKLSITGISSQDHKKPAQIDLGVKIDEYGQFTLKGNINPFSEKANAKLAANLDSLDLVPLSSYAGKFAGINIKRGTLGLDAKIKVKEDILDVKNTFYFNQLNVESNDTEVDSSIFKDMPMPLDLTLDVLRDKNNVIKLDIPVQGKVSNPDFRLQDVYNTAMAKAMKFAAVHYLKQAIQPLGLVITAGKLIGKAAIPKFDPLLFQDGTAEISDTNKKHIKNLAKILQDKDKLKFTICGTATESDWKVIQTGQKTSDTTKNAQSKSDTTTNRVNIRTQTLLKLANERTKIVKKYFVQTHKIVPKRLFICNGKISKDKEDKIAVPAVNVSL